MRTRAIALTAVAVLSASGLPATTAAQASTTATPSRSTTGTRGSGGSFVLAGATPAAVPAPSSAAIGVPPRVHAMTAASGAPAIAGRSPGRSATGIARTANVRVRFTKAVKASTIKIRLKDSVTGLAVAGKLTYTASTKTAVFNPTPTLRSHRRYVVVVSGATTKAGYVMAKSTWSFTTRP